MVVGSRDIVISQYHSAPFEVILELSSESLSLTSKYIGMLAGGDLCEASPSHRIRYICFDLADNDW